MLHKHPSETHPTGAPLPGQGPDRGGTGPARSETRLQTFPCRPPADGSKARVEVGVLSRPPAGRSPDPYPDPGTAAPAGTNGDGDAAKAGRMGARQNSKPRVRIGSARGMNHGRVTVDSAPRLGNKRIGSDSGPNRNVPPGVLSRPAKNPQAIGTIRWSLVAGVLEFCRATRDSLLESCRANY